MSDQRVLPTLVVPVVYNSSDTGSGQHKKITIPVTRGVSDAGRIRVMVGGGHGDVWGFTGAADFTATLFVREICLNSTV